MNDILAVPSHSVIVEVVILTLDLVVTGLVLVGDEVHDSIANFVEALVLVGGQVDAVVIEGVHNTVHEVRAGELHAILVVGGIVSSPAVSHSNTINVGLAVGVNAIKDLATVDAGQLAVNHLVGVAGSRNHGAPVHYGTTNVTISSIGVTVGQAGNSLVGQCNRSMVMPLHLVIIQVGSGGNAAGESTDVIGIYAINKGNGTADNLCVVRNDGAKTGCKNFILGVNRGISPRPNAGRNADQSLCTGQATLASLGHSNGHGVSILVHRSGSSEALCNDEVCIFPLVSSVQIQNSRKLRDGLNVGHVDIDVVDGVVLQQVVQIVMTAKSYRSRTGNGEGLALLGGVAHVVGNLKGNGVRTVGEIDLRAANGAVSSRNAGQCNTVNIDLSRIVIQAGSVGSNEISHRGVKGSLVVTHRVNGYVADDRSISVIDSITVVQSQLIKIEYQILRSIMLRIETDEAGLSPNLLGGILQRNVVLAG